MQSFRSFGLLLEEQWPALGPKWPGGRFWLHRSPHQCSDGAPTPQTLHAGVSRRPPSFGAALFGHLMSRWGAMAGFRAFRNENLGQNFLILAIGHQDGGEQS